MLFWMKTVRPTEPCITWDADPLRGRGNFLSCPAIKKRWLSSLPHRYRFHCNGDHSIANNVTQQKGSYSMPGKR